VCLVGGAVGAQERVTVTVRQLFDEVSWKWTT
jgi:hypothetical protein